MRATTFIIVALLLSVVGKAQNSPEQKDLGPVIRIETGMYIPLKELKRNIDISPTLSIVGGIPLNDKWRIDPNLTFFFPQSSSQISIVGQDSIVSGRLNSISGHWGASLNRVEKLGDRTFLEARLGTGLSFISTDTEKENVPEDSNDKLYGSETIFLQAGFGIKVFAFRYSYIGLEVNYYFTPYNLFGDRFVGNVGNQAISVGLSYGL
ncbi:hypothetical protein [Nonlabens agnitus]|uniref:Outer membrane protein beta-barrel domain-containing protein n=1 Tax=Nonlabens agnitus TaxID=870484 RepID=A0A2S9WTN1_9FLAO|nr:hypothetical protein [Nonlabens agnitus]PRP66841.1 hypothetical protein BST86_06855 [Nonlabens agnitus]